MPVEQFSSGPTKKLYTTEYVRKLHSACEEARIKLILWMKLRDNMDKNAGLIQDAIDLLS